MEIYRQSPQEALDEMKSAPSGLTQREADERLAQTLSLIHI